MRRRGIPFPHLMTVLLAGTLAPATASAQVGATTDIITGVVVGPDGRPLGNVVVEAMSLETEITRTTRTDQRGRYTILFPDGGGQYRMTARTIGVAPQTVTLVRHADEDRLVWDIRMDEPQFQLDDIVVTATLRPVRVPDRPTPGSVERNLTPDMIAALPIDPEDLNILATLVPGVVGIDATDSTANAFSVAGQRPDANNIVLDGLTFSSGQLPQEGLRNTRVITSTYDVSRGRFSGGLISATSRSGANALQGTFNYSLRDDALAFETGQSSPFTSGYTQHVVGGGLGGPLYRNRLFLYASGQFRLRTDPLASLTAATTNDLQRLGVAPDSVARLVSIVNDIGAVPETPLVLDDRSNDQMSALVRLDYLLSNNHTLTVRGDWRDVDREPSSLSAMALPETSGDNSSSGGGVAATLASRIGVQVINEAKVYLSRSERGSDPYLALPQGRVQVASELDDGTTGIGTLVFGGNPRMPTGSSDKLLEITNETSWLPGSGEHRFKLGLFFNAQRSENLQTGNLRGTFTFNSLADVEANQPASFSRTLGADERETTALGYAAYVGDVWRASRAFQLTYGLRLEGAGFRSPPRYNPALDSAFGRRTDFLPSEFDASPRAGFTWTIGGNFSTPPDLILRGGIGKFRSPLPLSLVSQVHASAGFPTEELSLRCVGAGVPIPDWTSYAVDETAIPDECLAPSPQVAVRAPSATVFSESFSAPKAWRTSIGLQRNLTSLLRLSVDATYARGVSQYGFRDINLDTSGGFRLAAEANRPVFVDPDQIVPATGAVGLDDSRLDPSFAEVMEIDSDLASETKQLTVSLGGVTRSGVVLQTAYTWSNVRDQSSQSVRGVGGRGGLGGTTTSGDPNVREWSRSSYERRHSFLATVSYPFGTTLDITGIGRLSSGTPYTPLVAADINGDGARNDQAFVFAPESSPPAVANGMDFLLANSSSGARACLEKQLGSIAERNSCSGPWTASFDLRMNYRPRFLGLNGNVSLSIVTQNLLRGIDEVLHGADGAHGWGDRSRPDATLLFVTGFDPATQQFSYAVNERFGATNTNARAFRNPFQIGLQIRASIGPNRGQAALDRLRGGRGFGGGREGGAGPPGGFAGGRGGLRGGGLVGADFPERFRSLVVNPAAVALEMKDSLRLTDEQVTALTFMSDSIAAETDSLAAQLQAEIEQAGNADPRGLMQTIRPWLDRAREDVRRGTEALRSILTDEQWELVPEGLRNQRQGNFPRRRRP